MKGNDTIRQCVLSVSVCWLSVIATPLRVHSQPPASSSDVAIAPDNAAPPILPERVRSIVLHVLGSPCFDRPARRFVFFTPAQTQAMWKPSFGTHWIVYTDGSLWPRYVKPGQTAGVIPPVDRPADRAWLVRLAAEAEPVFSHVKEKNHDTLGIELAHSGRSQDPFPEAQTRTLAWLLESLLTLSQGRLTPADIVGHKDLDQRPAYVSWRCEHAGCRVYVGMDGKPLRRRVDPPESLFVRLNEGGLAIPRPVAGGDDELRRAEQIGAGQIPRIKKYE